SDGCARARVCEPDSFEPNDDPEQATDLLELAADGSLQGTMCQDDTDYFALDLIKLAAGEESGVLMVDFKYNSRDVGMGEVEMEVLDPNGDTLMSEGTAPTGADGGVESLLELDTILDGDYLIRLSAQ